ncbi:Protein takeout [Lucilia cuprina]|uniref:Protein takeout n=1 Tax=Lucilia cuprina TaxID=7375 RepID=A0A0L0BTZ6_LUCCU|nr:Protein takeout [Lucilia cuprina]KNC23522.1 Protein takeout [Lucilia cuprina]
MLRFCFVLSVTLFCLNYGVNAKFPTDPKPCKYGDSECLTKTIEYFLKEKNQGDSSINLVKIDPLEVKKISIKQGAESPVNIDLTFTNSNIHGLSNTKVVKVKGFGKDIKGNHELTLRSEQLDLVGDYSVKGRILVLPITGTGKSNITMLNVDLIMKFSTTPMEKDGATYMKIDKFQLEPVPKGMIFKIDNLFNGDKVLGDNMNIFLNENWSEIYSEISGSIGSAFGKIFHSVIGHVFTKYPYEQYFSE